MYVGTFSIGWWGKCVGQGGMSVCVYMYVCGCVHTCIHMHVHWEDETEISFDSGQEHSYLLVKRFSWLAF